MGLLNMIDTLANAAAGSRMSSEQLSAHKERSQAANALADLADLANGDSVSRTVQRRADAALLEACGGDKSKAAKAKKDAAKRARRGLFG